MEKLKTKSSARAMRTSYTYNMWWADPVLGVLLLVAGVVQHRVQVVQEHLVCS